MEAFTGAKLMQNIGDLSHQPVSIPIMDDDAATMSKAKEVLGHDLEKWSDIGHSKKSASKVHKRTCYSTSESLENRIAAAAAQKNIGYNYMEDVFVKAHVSPSKILEVNCQKLSKEKKKRQLKFEGDPEIKKRKLLMKKEKRSNTESLEKKAK
ncbi:unnamed protein product [Mytilus coruscus]|uniref:Uncharacterized protein n=1 Tax=Mytilus coruscus TaxID=42192 RepID=A0A6J8CY93_MYTCO|nr:unnamed protein product [Mytilus coruscus]